MHRGRPPATSSSAACPRMATVPDLGPSLGPTCQEFILVPICEILEHFASVGSSSWKGGTSSSSQKSRPSARTAEAAGCSYLAVPAWIDCSNARGSFDTGSDCYLANSARCSHNSAGSRSAKFEAVLRCWMSTFFTGGRRTASALGHLFSSFSVLTAAQGAYMASCTAAAAGSIVRTVSPPFPAASPTFMQQDHSRIY